MFEQVTEVLIYWQLQWKEEELMYFMPLRVDVHALDAHPPRSDPGTASPGGSEGRGGGGGGHGGGGGGGDEGGGARLDGSEVGPVAYTSFFSR